MLYAMTGVAGISGVPGCPQGHTYDQRPDKSDPHMSIACPVHEAHLKAVKDPLWAATPADVPLTETERQQAEKAKTTFDAVAAQAVAGLAAMLAGGGLNIAQLAQQAAGQAPAAVPQAPAPAVPEAAAPAAGAAAPKAARPRKTKAPAGTAA